ncbi:hypothetical protein [Tuwongella immobilis]|uniref:Uncharacterized protein n=1 Tax=Tuwongella immobilis TaxID=692036 RepID=A0A6C2YGY0_9BACT|nr:hypothetical protein [Tuwongella immobilis]VIP00614.1 pbs lyase : Predicted protein OS=Streptomyces sp. C GN=SSNG_07003 PE=4 SV=1 [Tuwongella immobilis]VTR96646.1 pbs lyase : Predicted protein OS=Streptomyces sp. C GN=SSNG_07003 PE=4 SV=1 [Tuwongella immobilis]
MWERLHQVDWAKLGHAYGSAQGTPRALRQMISPDPTVQNAGWEFFWGTLNHQGDYYNSTVATIPFLIEALENPAIAGRVEILHIFASRWRDAPNYGGDPYVPTPPGGEDLPIPINEDAELWTCDPPYAVWDDSEADADSDAADGADSEDDEDSDETAQDAGDRRELSSGDADEDAHEHRPMNLCAWQTARGIEAGKPVYLQLLSDADRQVAQAAAWLLLHWRDTRIAAKSALVSWADDDALAPIDRATAILQFASFRAEGDAASFQRWLQPNQPPMLRLAAGLGWAKQLHPDPLPPDAMNDLLAIIDADPQVASQLPHVGILQQGWWGASGNVSVLRLRLAAHPDREFRWRIVQSLSQRYSPEFMCSDAETIPVLLARLADPFGRIVTSAMEALCERATAVGDLFPDAIDRIIACVEPRSFEDWGDRVSGLDNGATLAGQAVTLLKRIRTQLTPDQRSRIQHSLRRALEHFQDANVYISFGSMGIQAKSWLQSQLSEFHTTDPVRLHLCFECLAFSHMVKSGMRPAEALAELIARHETDPVALAEEARTILRKCTDQRNPAIGVGVWLMALGRDAEWALEHLDNMANGTLDQYARGRARDAAQFIRESLQVPVEPSPDPLGSPSQRIRAWCQSHPNLEDGIIQTELLEFLKDSSADVRTVALRWAANQPSIADFVAGHLDFFGELLQCGDSVEWGISDRFEFDSKTVFWRREIRSVRTVAIRVILELPEIPPELPVFAAMVDACRQPELQVWGAFQIPQFSIADWVWAAEATGDLDSAEIDLRILRQERVNEAWSERRYRFQDSHQLAKIIDAINGCVISHSE